MVASVIEPISGKTVLDFGCNLGGFLKVLWDEHQYQFGVGVDTNQDVINVAQREAGMYPIKFHKIDVGMNGVLETSPNTFDLAFSHEVLHFVPDIKDHARLMRRVLRLGGSYYALRSFSKDEVWERHKERVSKDGAEPRRYLPDDIVDAFEDEQFAVSARLLPLDWFTSCDREKRNEYFGLMGMLEHYSQRKILYRFSKIQ